jgi:signal transduction histidine kinase
VALRTRLVLLFTFAALVVGAAGGLLLARRLQLGLESDLDGVMRQRSAAVAASTQDGVPDLSAAEGPVQLIGPDGVVLANAGGASATTPLLPADKRARASRGVLIIDAVATLGAHREKVRILGRPAANGDLITVAVGRDPVDDVVQRTAVELTLLGTPATILVAFGVWLVTGAALRPVERMRAQAAAATPSRPAVLTVPPGGDELTRLALTLNDLLAAQQAALRAEQSFLADAGHELRTPLAILAGELEFADRPARTDAELRDTITVAREETTRLVRLAEQLLVLARVDGGGLQRGLVDVRALAGQAVTAWNATARASDVEVVLRAGDEVTAWIDADRTRQMLDNLLANAVRVAPPGTAVEISVSSGISGSPGRGFELTVRDHGPGFPPEFIPQAFERFRRADFARARAAGRCGSDAAHLAGAGAEDPGTGLGLGLALVRSIAEAHDGTAIASNCQDGGAAVTVLLPMPRDDGHRPTST